jgi:short subunit dehydrogenase-like uncharacterized protein
MRETWLLYGATGYTGRRIARNAVEKGAKPVLAGRRESELRPLAEELGLDWEVFHLDDAALVQTKLARHAFVLNAAGPFAHTYRPIVEGCLAAGAHYLDISGEVDAYEGLAGYHDAALRAGIMVMPAIGFDMVPGDCLALALRNRLPDARVLDIGYSFDGTVSRGSARSALLAFSPETTVRRGGVLETLAAPTVRSFDFGPQSDDGRTDCHSMTFGDVSIGWRTTGIPDITAYIHLTKAFQDLAALPGPAALDQMPDGPTDEELTSLSAFIVGEATNERGQVVRARLRTPQVYALTFELATDIAQRVHDGLAPPGFQTPARALGGTYISNFGGCELQWLAG